jgi:hypothetical protein
VAGTAFGHTSPVQVSSPLLFVDVSVADASFGDARAAPTAAAQGASSTSPRTRIDFGDVPPDFELAIYVIAGTLSFGTQAVAASELVIVPQGLRLSVDAVPGTHFIVIGGTPFGTERYIWWNLVSSSKARIEAAKRAWQDRTFPQVEGDPERIDLPDRPGP